MMKLIHFILIWNHGALMDKPNDTNDPLREKPKPRATCQVCGNLASTTCSCGMVLCERHRAEHPHKTTP